VQIAQFTKKRLLMGLITLQVLDVSMPVRPPAPAHRIEEHLCAVEVQVIAEYSRDQRRQDIVRKRVEQRAALAAERRTEISGCRQAGTVDQVTSPRLFNVLVHPLGVNPLPDSDEPPDHFRRKEDAP
jgi:hypothetical protein